MDACAAYSAAAVAILAILVAVAWLGIVGPGRAGSGFAGKKAPRSLAPAAGAIKALRPERRTPSAPLAHSSRGGRFSGEGLPAWP